MENDQVWIFTHLFFLLEVLVHCNKAVGHQMDIKCTISKEEFWSQFDKNIHTLESYKICLLTSSKHSGNVTSLTYCTAQRVRRG